MLSIFVGKQHFISGVSNIPTCSICSKYSITVSCPGKMQTIFQLFLPCTTQLLPENVKALVKKYYQYLPVHNDHFLTAA